MTYANLPYPDLPTLPLYLSQNPYHRIHRPPQPPPEPPNDYDEEPSLADEEEFVEDEEGKVNGTVPILRLSNLLFSYDDPERTSFFFPLLVLLVVHALFLVYLHVYAPASGGAGDGEQTVVVMEGSPYSASSSSLIWNFGGRGKRYYDVGGLKSASTD